MYMYFYVCIYIYIYNFDNISYFCNLFFVNNDAKIISNMQILLEVFHKYKKK